MGRGRSGVNKKRRSICEGSARGEGQNVENSRACKSRDAYSEFDFEIVFDDFKMTLLSFLSISSKFLRVYY